MNKRKLLMLAASLCLVAILVAGGTLAYFTDADAATNVFTVGYVEIDLQETFDEDDARLFPATYEPDGTLREDNVITKEVWVQNTGSDNAYVRVHIAIPSILDDVDNAGNNILHFNYREEAPSANGWDWSKTPGEPYTGDWNVYYTTINEIEYNVYVVTCLSEVEPGNHAADVPAMDQVYLDKNVTNEKVAEINETLGNEWHIYVVAEGAQTNGFNNAYEALNTAFGEPGTYDIDWAGVAEYVDEYDPS